MVGAGARGSGGWGGRVATVGVLILLAGCGGGGDGTKEFTLPAGTEFDTLPARKVLISTAATNECRPGRDCVPAPPGSCHTGDGNTRGLAIHRLGTTGLLVGNATGDGATPEQVLATDDNPRRLVVHPKDPTLVYVATRQRIQVFRLASGGNGRCIGETLAENEVDPDAPDLEPIDMTIDPIVDVNGVLYVASKGANRVDAYAIAPDGTIPSIPTSCAVGPGDAEYQAVANVSPAFIAAGGDNRIDIFRLQNGQFPAEIAASAAAESSPTPSPSPEVTPAPTPTATPTPSPAPTCIGARLVTEPISSIGSAIVTDMFFSPSAGTPLGELFVAEEVSRRIFTFPVDAAGVIDGDDSSSTGRDGLPQVMLRLDRGDASLLYVSEFQEGRIDVFRLEEGLLPDGSFSRTTQGVDALPVGLAVDADGGAILYVAQGGFSRVDGYRIQEDGGLADLPATSTALVRDASGAVLETFPNDVAIVPLP